MNITEKLRGVPLHKRLWNRFYRFFFPVRNNNDPVSLIYADSFWVTFFVILIPVLFSMVFFHTYPAHGENTGGPYFAGVVLISYLAYRRRKHQIPNLKYRKGKEILLPFLSLFLFVPLMASAIYLGHWLLKRPEVLLSHIFLVLLVAYLWARLSMITSKYFVAMRYWF